MKYCRTCKTLYHDDELRCHECSKKLKEHIIAINSLEEEADSLYVSSMYKLHGETDPIAIIAWRDIYMFLEKCLDTSEHIADIVESVVMKNT